ncbi:MAG: nuclear transport factor 2 family protein, partial [Vicinamibacterales bacterium]
ELIQIENDWCTADLKKDAVLMEKILTSDFTGVGSRGGVDTKESTLAAYKDATSSTTACVNSNMKARVFGEAAVVTGTVTSSGTYKGAAFKDRHVLFTDTYVRRDGRWQCVASQGTVAAAPQK